MTLSIFGLFPQAASIVHLPVYGGSDVELAQFTNREDHLVQKEILAELVHEYQGRKGEAVGFAGFNDPSKATLIDFRRDFPGLIGKPVIKAVCVPLYYQEVNPQEWVIPWVDMEARLQVARKCGLLMMEPNKAVAIVLGYESDEAAQSTQVFMTDENGMPRVVNGVFPYDRRIRGSQPSIASLNKHQTEQALGEVAADKLVEAARLNPSSVRLDLLAKTETLLSAHLVDAPPERKPSGAIIHRSFAAGGTGQVAETTRFVDGWVRYPTSQDAWYFGVWVNFGSREVITYAEGDITHVVCLDPDPFEAELKEMAEFYGRDRLPCAKGFGEDGITHFYDTLFRTQCEHRVVALFPVESSELPIFVAVKVTADEVVNLEVDQERVLSSDVFEMDLLHVSAFASDNSLRAMRTDAGIAFILETGNRQYTGQLA